MAHSPIVALVVWSTLQAHLPSSSSHFTTFGYSAIPRPAIWPGDLRPCVYVTNHDHDYYRRKVALIPDIGRFLKKGGVDADPLPVVI
jgi:hypothetical protein